MKRVLISHKVIIVNLLWFIVLLVLSWTYPYDLDDYVYMNSMHTGMRIESFSQIIMSAIHYYFNWGGRFLSFVLLQLMLLLPKSAFNILNAIVYVLTINVISRIGLSIMHKKENDDNRALILAVLYFSNWFFGAQFGQVNLWLTGSITYLWMTCIVLSFAYIVLLSGDGCKKNYQYCGVFILGLCGGLSLEVGSCTLIISVVAMCFIRIKRGDHLNRKLFVGSVGLLLGFMLLMLAPGNHVRSSLVSELYEETSFLRRYGWRIARETYYAVRYLAIPAAMSLSLFMLRIKRRPVKKSIIDFEPEIFVYVLAFFGVYVMTFSSGYSLRAIQFPLFLLLIAESISMAELFDDMKQYLKRDLMIPCMLLFFVVVVEMATGIMQAKRFDSHFDRYTTYHYMDESSSLIDGNGAMMKD